MSRTLNIVGRVLRNLNRHGVTTSQVLDEDIYDEMTQAINRIISDINTDKIITITLKTDEDTYPLTTDAVDEEVLRGNIASVKIVKLPVGWLYNFEVVSNKEFVGKVNANQTPPISQPVIGTVIDNKLKMFPAPDSTYNDVEMEFFVYLSSSTQNIDKDTEPELNDIWDKAIEFFVTAQFLSGAERQQWLNEYNIELKRLRPLQHRKHFNLQSPSVWNYSVKKEENWLL